MDPSEIPVETVIEDDRWEAFGLPDLATRAVRATLEDRGLPPDFYSLCLMACDDARIATLNAGFRGKAQPTNVLSWPSEDRAAEADGAEPERPEPGDSDDPTELGDIAIAWETCLREAAEQDKTMEAHVSHLVVHATLHLLGYDHIGEQDATLMEDAERRILATLGISDPY
jgi:probable rRNA maturation factor